MLKTKLTQKADIRRIVYNKLVKIIKHELDLARLEQQTENTKIKHLVNLNQVYNDLLKMFNIQNLSEYRVFQVKNVLNAYLKQAVMQIIIHDMAIHPKQITNYQLHNNILTFTMTFAWTKKHHSSRTWVAFLYVHLRKKF